MKALLYCLIFIGYSFSAMADIETYSVQQQAYESAKQQLAIAKERNRVAQQQLEHMKNLTQKELEKLTPFAVNTAALEKASLGLILLQANLESVKIAVAEAVQISEATNIKIESLKRELHDVTLAAGKMPAVKKRLDNLQTELNDYYKLQKIQESHLDVLQASKQLAEEMYERQRNWKKALLAFYEKQQKEKQRIEAQKKELHFQMAEKKWLTRLSELNTQLQNLPSDALENKSQVAKLEIAILEAQEKSNLSRLELVFTRLWSQASDLGMALNKTNLYPNAKQLKHQSDIIYNEAKEMTRLIQSKLTLLKQQKIIEEQLYQGKITSRNEYKADVRLIEDLFKQYTMIAEEGQALLVDIAKDQTVINEVLNTMIARRQGLPGLNMWAWASLGEKLLTMPALAFKALMAMKDALVLSLYNLSPSRILWLLIMVAGWLYAWLSLKKGLSAILFKLIEKRRNVSGNILYVVLRLLRSNLISLVVFFATVSLLWFGGFTIKVFTPLLTILLIWIGFKSMMDLSCILLLETADSGEGKDLVLYDYLRGIFISGGILALLTLLSHQLPVDYEVSDFFNRLFMLYLFIASALLLWRWNSIPTLVAFYFPDVSSRIIRIVSLLSVLIPFTVLVNAAIGFLGYITLAWTMSRYTLIFLLVLAIYSVGRGFIHDFYDWLSEVFIRRFRNGWLWTQAYLLPLDRISRIAWFFTALYWLFHWYGWDKNSYVVQQLQIVIHTPFLKVSNTTVTLLGVAEFIAAVFLLLWLAKWTREFAYRWWYARAKDVGVRHSLAVFTQYAVVLFGALVILQWSGMDLSGLHLVLGALAFGIGFGLRDLARNYVSGVLMLVERPLRTGDLVSIGNFEGQVTHIGMRATTVRTWDRMEVLVPNSETFEKSFVNWTRQDSIVRTVVTINLNRQDDLEAVVTLIMDVLNNIPEVVSEPPPQVYLKNMSDSLIEVEVRYFINLIENISRDQVRSVVLFSLWNCFKEAGIQPPFPQQDLHIRTFPDKKT